MIQPAKKTRTQIIIEEYLKRGKLTKKLQKEVAEMLSKEPIEEFINVIPVHVLEDAFAKHNPQFREHLKRRKLKEVDPDVD